MLRGGNSIHIVHSGTTLTFTAEKTGNVFRLAVVPVVGEQDGTPIQGVRLTLGLDGDKQAAFPQGAKLFDAMGQRFELNDERIIAKGLNACGIVDVDGSEHRLFQVKFVDAGLAGVPFMTEKAAILYFHDEHTVPPELGGPGLLRVGSYSAFECG